MQARLTRKWRVKKKSDIDGVEGEAEAGGQGDRETGGMVVEEAAGEAEAASQSSEPVSEAVEAAGDASAEAPAHDEKEENIYEVMKEHMRRQKEELEAKNAQLRQQRQMAGGGGGGYGRPGPAQQPSAPVIEKVTNVSDLNAVWASVRRYLASTVRYLESVLGHCCRIESLDPKAMEAVLFVPSNQKGFTNEKARLKIEEGVRLVTGLPVKLGLHFGEEAVKAPDAEASAGGTGGVTAQRVPPEVVEAVKAQPVIKDLMKKLDATVVNVELMGTGEGE